MNAAAPYSLAKLQARFLELVPRIELHGRIFFRQLKCRDSRAEAIAEMIALAWKWFVRLIQRGKDAADFMRAFTRFIGFAVKSGRRLCGQEKAKDVMSPVAQQKKRFKVESLPITTRTSYQDLCSSVRGQRQHDAFEERLQDNTLTPVPEQAAFRIDWPAWVKTRTERDRRIIDDLMAGQRTLDVSRKYGLSPGRVSQLRQEFHQDWLRFHGETSDQQLAYAA